jgi:predicted nucleic acid-binding protein
MPGRLVIADASPLHYLVLIGCGGILPALFERVFIPTVVRDELLHPETPEIVRSWMENTPGWLEVRVASRRPLTTHPCSLSTMAKRPPSH